MPTATSFFSRPPLSPFGRTLPNPLDLLPAAIDHLLATEAWARARLAPHVGQTLHIVVAPFTIRLTIASESSVVRAAPGAVADTTITLPSAAIPRVMTGGAEAALRDLRVEGDAELAQAVSMLAKNLRWDVEEDLSKVIGDAASHRVVATGRAASGEVRRVRERLAANVVEYLLDEDPQLVRPRAVTVLADGIRTLRDDLARLEKRVDRLTIAAPVASRR